MQPEETRTRKNTLSMRGRHFWAHTEQEAMVAQKGLGIFETLKVNLML